MPAPARSARVLLASALTVLLMLVGAPGALAGPGDPASAGTTSPGIAATAPGGAGVQPSEPLTVGGVALDLVDPGPTALTPGSTLTMTLRLTNTTPSPIAPPRVELRTRTDRITSRAELADWESETGPDVRGPMIGAADLPEALGPGESREITVAVPADALGYSSQDYLWGARRISLTVFSGTEGLGSLRTFTVWRPAGSEDADAQLQQSILLPIGAADPGSVIADPAAFAASEADGRLAALRVLSDRPDVDWLLDPALLDPPALPVGPQTLTPGQTAEEQATAEEQEQAQQSPPAPGAEEAPVSDAGGAADQGSAPEASAAPAAPGLSAPLEYAPSAEAVALAEQLRASAAGRTVLGTPFARADVGTMRAAGTRPLLTAIEDRTAQAWEAGGLPAPLTAGVIPAAGATGAALTDAIEAGADVLVVPSASVIADPDTVTPSGVGTWAGPDGDVPVLAPDSALSAQISTMTQGEDAEARGQRILAETAVISSEQVTPSRQLLIMPTVQPTTDAAGISALLDRFGQAPWLESASVQQLLDVAGAEPGAPAATTSTEDGPSALYALGPIAPESVHPTAVDPQGRLQQRDAPATLARVTPEDLRRLQSSLEDIAILRSVMQDPQQLEGPRDLLLTSSSTALADQPQLISDRTDLAAAQLGQMHQAITVIPASGYNLVSDSAGVPITISNQLDTPITVQIRVRADRPIVDIGEPPVVEVPARGQTEVVVPIDALANGMVTLTAVLLSEDGQQVSAPVSVPLSVNPAWENWVTMALVAAMGVLVVIGVMRSRRNGPGHRAPAQIGPEPLPDDLSEDSDR